MGWPKSLVLVRHAESEGNIRSPEERAGLDIPTYAYKLTKRGRKQANITGKYLKENFGNFDVYYVSYYERSRETMRIMYPEVHVYEDPRLAEGQRGIFHTMTEEKIKEIFPYEMARREKEKYYHFRPFGGENWMDMELRIHSFLGTLSRDCEGLKVLIVVHGHWEILLQRLIHHFSIEETIGMYQNRKFENASITVYEGYIQVRNSLPRLKLIYENFVPWKGIID